MYRTTKRKEKKREPNSDKQPTVSNRAPKPPHAKEGCFVSLYDCTALNCTDWRSTPYCYRNGCHSPAPPPLSRDQDDDGKSNDDDNDNNHMATLLLTLPFLASPLPLPPCLQPIKNPNDYLRCRGRHQVHASVDISSIAVDAASAVGRRRLFLGEHFSPVAELGGVEAGVRARGTAKGK